jgi:hypothetical protein
MNRISRMAFFSSFLLICMACSLSVSAQESYVTVSGTVRDAVTGKTLAYASVSVPDQRVSTVTNADGAFIIKTATRPEHVFFSHVGYKTRRFPIEGKLNGLTVLMSQSTIMLSEVVVASGNAREILKAALSKIPQNYSSVPELFRGFYRETTMRGHRYIYVAEAVMDLYKSEYTKSVLYDKVCIDKARRMISTKQSDTLGAKIQGGPTLPIYLDLVKNSDDLFNAAELDNYDFAIEPPTHIGDRPQVVISLRPNRFLDYALYYGKVYIDKETLAFSRIELQLDVSDKDKATRVMLVHKPLGVRFKPKEMSLQVNYSFENGVSRISYVRSTSRFNCDWKRKLFHSGYEVNSEMVVTDRMPQDKTHSILKRDSFGEKSSLYDKIESFDAPDFWGPDNIIEPTESLENAIDKLKKKLRE